MIKTESFPLHAFASPDAPGRRPRGLMEFPSLLPPRTLTRFVQAYNLTGREAEALELLLRGLSDRAVAGRLGVSLETLRKHRRAVLRKCGCANRLQLVLALVHGKLECGDAPALPLVGAGGRRGPHPSQED